MKLGDKVTLWFSVSSNEAYQDQCGFWRPGKIVTQEVVVTVVETKKVPGVYTPTDKYDGFRATSEDGREFFLNWGHLDECSFNPTFHWEHLDSVGKWHLVADAFQAVNFPIPYVRDNQRAVPDGAVHCKVHQEYHPATGECFRCKHKIK